MRKVSLALKNTTLSKRALRVSLLTGGHDAPYVLPLASTLASQGVIVDFIGGDDMQNTPVARTPKVHYHNLRGDQSETAPLITKIFRVLNYYWKLIRYSAQTDSTIFHIQWLNKFVYFDRTVLSLYYKILGKKLVFTAHNVNAAERDGSDTLMNRLTLWFMYRTMDHIIVHTQKMKLQLINSFRVEEKRITVVPFGINNTVPRSQLSRGQARGKLGLSEREKVLLFFGQIAPYKGLEYLLLALAALGARDHGFKLVIAGRVNKGCDAYREKLWTIIQKNGLRDCVVTALNFIRDEDVEVYFKSADVTILPYRHIFQSGVLLLSYSFGLPVIATDVGSLREDVIEGQTGYVCKAQDALDLAEKIRQYFRSGMYKNLESSRRKIVELANERYAWERIGEKTCAVYKSIPQASSDTGSCDGFDC
jgi:D-inositol-3-phosphate glycosyltransferase